MFDALVSKSREFHRREPFHSNLQPTQSLFFSSPKLCNRIESIRDRSASPCRVKEAIVRDAEGTRPILHRSVVPAIQQYLDIKSRYGTPAEQEMYRPMTPELFLRRLLICRPVVFMNSCDSFVLKNGVDGAGLVELRKGR